MTMDDNDQFRTGDDPSDQNPWDGRNKPAWFGPKAFGVGYSPQTWQGYLVTAGVVLLAILLATVVKGRHGHHSPLILLTIIPAIAIPRIIIMIQRR
jgi:hypothetical protein